MNGRVASIGEVIDQFLRVILYPGIVPTIVKLREVVGDGARHVDLCDRGPDVFGKGFRFSAGKKGFQLSACDRALHDAQALCRMSRRTWRWERGTTGRPCREYWMRRRNDWRLSTNCWRWQHRTWSARACRPLNRQDVWLRRTQLRNSWLTRPDHWLVWRRRYSTLLLHTVWRV